MKYRLSIFLGLAIALLPVVLPACSPVKQTNRWFRSGSWYNGLPLTPYAGIDRPELESQYRKNKAVWDEAFRYLKETDLATLPTGKHSLVGDDLTVSVTEASDKAFDDTRWESHRKYIDIQYIARGQEKMGVAPAAEANVINPYNEKKDVANYSTEGTYYIAKPGTMYIFFPGDAHRPSIKVDDTPVKKVVLKVKYVD